MSGALDQTPTPPVAQGGAEPETPLYRMSPLEVACGWVPGLLAEELSHRPPAPAHPLAALEEAIRPALCRPPCMVQFSGGRDSSLVLAVALRSARRLGLQEPVALTHCFPGLDETREEQWQELVVRHLGVSNWERVDVSDELDLVGPVCGASLRRHGLLWPPMVHSRHFDFARAVGGSLLDGEGGDEVLGPGRLAVVGALLSGRARPDREVLKQLALVLSPPPVRRRVARHLYRRHIRPPWLRPGAWHVLESALADDFAGEPLDRRRSLLRHARLRMVTFFRANSRALGREHDVLDVKPLLDVGFLTALGRAGGRMGFTGRGRAMSALFAEILPDEVLHRADKPRFNRVAFNVHSRAFVAGWDGHGVDDELVDPEGLRRAWAEDEPNALSFALLQAAWLNGAQRTAPR